MKHMIDFLIALKQLGEPKTIEQMERMNFCSYKEFVYESIEKGYIISVSTTPMNIKTYWLSDIGEKAVEDEIRRRNQ